MNSLPLTTTCFRKIRNAEGGETGFYSLPALDEAGVADVSRLPISLRIVLESAIRRCDDDRVTVRHVRELASWKPNGERTAEVPFFVARVALNDTAGIPVLGDLAAMRNAAARHGIPLDRIRPQVPVDMVMDHSLEVQYSGAADALRKNMEFEIERNVERFTFVKWAMQAMRGIKLVPPGFGILHQVNLERLARVVICADGLSYPDTVIGPDSHTGMVSSLGVLSWGCGGIEVAAALLGEPIYFLMPDVVGVNIVGELGAGVMATDMVIALTKLLREAKVSGKFVEFFGEGARTLRVPDRATLVNMAPEYGARLGFFPVDDVTCQYLTETGRSDAEVDFVRRYYQEQQCFGTPRSGEIDYSQVITFDLNAVVPCVAGPKRPQDLVPLPVLKESFRETLQLPAAQGGYGKAERHTGPMLLKQQDSTVRDGDIVIASITSCANTSNPTSMLAAGLLAKKAVAAGLKPKQWVKTSLAPGSVAVSKYLEAAGLQAYLDSLGFQVVGYGCATCVGNSGPIAANLEQDIAKNGRVAVAVLSGNRNFEGRTHPAVRATYLMSPALVVAFALAGTIDFDPAREPVGHTPSGVPVMLREIWPSLEEVERVLSTVHDPRHYRQVYDVDFGAVNALWNSVPTVHGETFPWNPDSTYFREPPFFTDASLSMSSLHSVIGARALAILGDSITTDHISPISDIGLNTPAGEYLRSRGVLLKDFSSYGARRVNYEVMIRGTFANTRLRNFLADGREGGLTKHQPTGAIMPIYDAALRYKQEGVPLIVVAGEEYGTGSARDWAAKGPRLLGVRAVVAKSFERIHRSNLVGLGILPCQLDRNFDVGRLAFDGTETFDILGLDGDVKPRQRLMLVVRAQQPEPVEVPLTLLADSRQELQYLKSGGLLQHALAHVDGHERPGRLELH